MIQKPALKHVQLKTWLVINNVEIQQLLFVKIIAQEAGMLTTKLTDNVY